MAVSSIESFFERDKYGDTHLTAMRLQPMEYRMMNNKQLAKIKMRAASCIGLMFGLSVLGLTSAASAASGVTYRAIETTICDSRSSPACTTYSLCLDFCFYTVADKQLGRVGMPTEIVRWNGGKSSPLPQPGADWVMYYYRGNYNLTTNDPSQWPAWFNGPWVYVQDTSTGTWAQTQWLPGVNGMLSFSCHQTSLWEWQCITGTGGPGFSWTQTVNYLEVG